MGWAQFKCMPDFTHLSSDNGTYIYAEASSPRRPGDKAILVSQQIPANTRPGNCIIFWYHMYGAHVSVLNMYIQTGSGALPKPTWTRNGTQGNEWKKGMVFYPSALPYKVRSCGVIRNDQCYCRFQRQQGSIGGICVYRTVPPHLKLRKIFCGPFWVTKIWVIH